jgi:hypothetical protein
MIRLLLIAALLATAACIDGRGGGSTAAPAASDWYPAGTGFRDLVERLSEPGGYFDTDNLISNEASYLHVMGKMRELGVNGGVYVGVGPDQNFSYIAQIRPEIAFIIDIRRDNLLQHLLFKTLFSLARNRVEYLCLLTGRTVPSDVASWNDRDIEELIEYIDRTPTRPESIEHANEAVRSRIRAPGLHIDDDDYNTIHRIHSRFIDHGLSLRFSSHGRGARPYYPTFRQMLLETDLTGQRANYLAREEDYQFLRALQESDLVVPVVGDLSGDHALAAIGELVAEREARVSAFYTSNVEFYLMRGGRFDFFVRNLQSLPHDTNSLIIRSYFGRNFGYGHPQSVPGYYATQLLQPIGSLLREYSGGRVSNYFDLVSRGSLDLKTSSDAGQRRSGNAR